MSLAFPYPWESTMPVCESTFCALSFAQICLHELPPAVMHFCTFDFTWHMTLSSVCVDICRSVCAKVPYCFPRMLLSSMKTQLLACLRLSSSKVHLTFRCLGAFSILKFGSSSVSGVSLEIETHSNEKTKPFWTESCSLCLFLCCLWWCALYER